jgi:hypothetical protein
MNNRIYFGLILFAGWIAPNLAWSAACSVNGSGQITDTGWCGHEPTNYTMTIYKIGLCTSEPTLPPNTTTAADLSMCSTVFESTTGSEITITDGVGNAPSGAFTRPPNGAYSHAYAVIAPVFKIRSNITFSGSRTAFGGASGAVCWTKTHTAYSRTASNNSGAVDCASTLGATLGTTTINQNNFGGQSEAYTATASVPGGTMNAVLATSDLKLASGAANDNFGTITRILATTPFATSATFTDATTGISLQIKTSEGSSLNMTRGQIGLFDSGPFVMKIAPE